MNYNFNYNELKVKNFKIDDNCQRCSIDLTENRRQQSINNVKIVKKTNNRQLFALSTKSKLAKSTNNYSLSLLIKTITKTTNRRSSKKSTNRRSFLLKSNSIVNRQITFNSKLKLFEFQNIRFRNKNNLLYFIFKLIDFERLCISKFIKTKIFR